MRISFWATASTSCLRMRGCAARPKRKYRPHLGIYFYTTDTNSNGISQNTLSNRHTGMNVYTIFRLLAYSEILGEMLFCSFVIKLNNLRSINYGQLWWFVNLIFFNYLMSSVYWSIMIYYYIEDVVRGNYIMIHNGIHV